MNFRILRGSSQTQPPPAGWRRVMFFSFAVSSSCVSCSWSDQIRSDQVRHALVYLKIQILTMSSKKSRFHYSVIPRNEKEVSLCDVTKGSDASPGFVTGPRAGWDAFCPPYLSSLQTHEGSNNVLEHSFEECCKQRANKC